MSGDTANPRIWVGASIYTAPYGSTAPTDFSTALAGAWEDLGLLSEDGLTESRDEDQTDHWSWGSTLVRTTRAKHKRTFKFAALEDNAIVWQLTNPGSVTFTSGGMTTRTAKIPQADPRAFVIARTDGTVRSRIHIPRGEILENGDIVSSDSEMTMYEFTVTVYPSGDGTLYREFTNNPAAADLVS